MTLKASGRKALKQLQITLQPASYHGISIKSIAKNQVVLNSGTYGSNPVWIHAIGK